MQDNRGTPPSGQPFDPALAAMADAFGEAVRDGDIFAASIHACLISTRVLWLFPDAVARNAATALEPPPRVLSAVSIQDPDYKETVQTSLQSFRSALNADDGGRAVAALEAAGILPPAPRREDELRQLETQAAAAGADQRIGLLPQLAKLAVRAGDLDRAARYAAEALDLASRQPVDHEGSRGEAVHDGNVVLGVVALRRGDVAAAKRHLLLAARMEGSPYPENVRTEHDVGARTAASWRTRCCIGLLEGLPGILEDGRRTPGTMDRRDPRRRQAGLRFPTRRVASQVCPTAGSLRLSCPPERPTVFLAGAPLSSWRGSAKTRGLTTPSQGAHRLSRKPRAQQRRVDGAVCPRGFRPRRAHPLVPRERCQPGAQSRGGSVRVAPRAAIRYIGKDPAAQAPVAQLDRASGYEPEGRVFESPRAHHKTKHLSSISAAAFPVWGQPW